MPTLGDIAKCKHGCLISQKNCVQCFPPVQPEKAATPIQNPDPKPKQQCDVCYEPLGSNPKLCPQCRNVTVKAPSNVNGLAVLMIQAMMDEGISSVSLKLDLETGEADVAIG
jgi:hypothetical protein